VLAQDLVGGFGAEAAVGQNAIDAHAGVLGPGDRAGEQPVVVRVAPVRHVGDHKASAVSAMRAL
jgi:hypothetical protein